MINEAQCAYRASDQGSEGHVERLQGHTEFGIHTQARSARFKTDRVLSFLPNKIPAVAQSRAFVKSSSVRRTSERPKMVSLGGLMLCSGDILLRTGVRLANAIEQDLIYRGMDRSSDIDEFKR